MADMFAWAQIAYRAYGEATGGPNHRGEPMPAWDDLPLVIKMAGERAALAVRQVPAGGP